MPGFLCDPDRRRRGFRGLLPPVGPLRRPGQWSLRGLLLRRALPRASALRLGLCHAGALQCRLSRRRRSGHRSRFLQQHGIHLRADSDDLPGRVRSHRPVDHRARHQSPDLRHRLLHPPSGRPDHRPILHRPPVLRGGRRRGPARMLSHRVVPGPSTLRRHSRLHGPDGPELRSKCHGGRWLLRVR